MNCKTICPPERLLGRIVLMMAVSLWLTEAAMADVSKGAVRQRQLTQVQVRHEAPAAKAGSLTKSTAKGECQKSCDCCLDQKPDELVITTGTHIPVNSKKRLQVSDGAQNVRVLDRKQLERTGTPDLGEAIHRLEGR